MYKELAQILRLQEIDKDLIITKKNINKIKNSSKLKAAIDHLKKIDMNLEELEKNFANRKLQLRSLEREVIHSQNLIKGLDEEIYSGKNNSKELHYLIYEKENNSENIQNLEEEMMVLLEDNEKEKEYLSRLKKQKNEMQQRFKNIKKNLDAKKNELDSKVFSLETEREKIVSLLPDDLYSKYNDKKERLNYKFVCQIDQSGMCLGCHVKLPSRVIKNLYNKEVQRCDECGRYLIYVTD